MNYFIDIKLVASKEIQENILLNHIYTNFHKRLYDLKADTIGVSFPRYRLKLGNIFRIHGKKDDLQRLQEEKWLDDMAKFCIVNEILAVPKNVKHRTVSRIQQTMSQSKLRRLIKRAEEGKGGISQDDIKKYKIKMLQGGLDNPFVELTSGSSGERHRRFIQFSDLSENQIKGTFDLFGLSKEATVPWF